ncbi:uncharacterized protein LOC141717310 [Apium graveolens]|uniref:uncharacterized protein LOC141717310 n=1 Tax=Apium graveolens TaxID=4045 RepID=UPI003D7AFC69
MGSCFRKHSSSHEDDVDKENSPVVVELFSSLGDASSPEAEMLFSQVGRGDYNLEMPVILLAYHVDYWNHMGWKDPFGSSLWTVRQKAYNEALQIESLYTPQAVFQGKAQCRANIEEKLLPCINAAPRYPGLAFQATFERPSKDKLQVTLTGHLRSKVDSHGVNINVALYENGLVTDVENGPNIGRVLTTDYVVRKLEKLCFVKDITPKQEVSGTLKFNLWEGFDSCKCGIAVFLQDDYLYIFGSQDIKLPDDLEIQAL